MWNLDIHPFELAIRALAVYVLLLLMMRMTGRRTVGQFTPFDLLVVMLVSEAAGPSMTGSDQSLPGGLLVCVILIALNTAVGFVTARWRVAEKLLEGEAVLLGRDGKIFEGARKSHRVSRNDIEKALREADCEESEIRCMFLEADGSLSVQKKQ
ncbi:YetF domain-containing protein [Delftia tsuruhatensis]